MLIISSFCFALQNCSIVPQPRECLKSDSGDILITADTSIIYDIAAEVDSYAALHLKENLSKHYKTDIQLKNDKADNKIVLGTLGKDSFIENFCKENKIELNTKLSGFDGYIIKTVKTKAGSLIVAAGANPRGTTYAASVLFDLLQIKNEKLTCPASYIRDWATIQWRGRPTEYLALQTEESLDTCVHSRINLIDIRDSNAPDGHAFCGIPAGSPLNTDKIKKVIDTAHARGIIVFGTVSCSVPPERFGDVMKTFKELIALKIDGLWASFDDLGPGQDSPLLVEKIIQLGKENNIPPEMIAITPPSGSYQEVDTVWNRQVVKMPDADKIKWFFTRVPNKFDDDLMKKLGFKSKLCWWHNWPRPKGGLLTDFAGGRPLYQSKWGYYELMPLAAGWNNPSRDELFKAPDYTDAVMLWQSRPADYDCHVLGLWAWNPKIHDFNAVSQTAYSYVFGKSAANDARKFDEAYLKLTPYFTTPLYKTVTPSLWPPRLRNVSDRPAAMQLVNEMDSYMQKIEQAAPSHSMLCNENLKIDYLQPMRDLVIYGKIMTNLDYPEYTHKNFAERMLNFAENNNIDAIKTETANIKADVEKKCQTISTELAKLKFIDVYVKQWNDYVSGTDFWMAELKKNQAAKAEAEQKKAEAKQKFAQIVNGDYKSLFADQSKAAKGKVLLEISPQQINKGRLHTRGDWGIGLYDDKAVAIGSSSKWTYKDSDIAQISTEVNIPNFTKRLYLEVYIAHIVKDTQKPERTDVRLSVLRVDNKTIWNQDLTVPLKGWQVNDITDVAKPGEKVNIRFLVSNRVNGSGYESIVFFGPARLVER